MEKIRIGILGATSYTGNELIRLLAFHPNAEIVCVSSQSYASKRICDIYPELKGIFDGILLAPDAVSSVAMDCLFSCLPHAVSAELLIPFIEKGIRVIDLSADFRLKDPVTYKTWYMHEHPSPEYLEQAVFGLPERYRNAIATASILANPGCYVTSILLPLLPLFETIGKSIDWIIADSKSGVSGAGRTLKLVSHFVEANENCSAYSVGHTHRHTPEIEQELSFAARRPVSITFSPHLLPINRGILSTIYIHTRESAQTCKEIVAEAYANEPFIRMREASDMPRIAGVAHTNYCDMAFAGGGSEIQPVIAISAIDNLLKGASGQAVQNMNIMFGLSETAGLLR